MPLDMQEIRRLPKRPSHVLLSRSSPPIKTPHPAMEIRISAPDIPQITLEMLNVHGVEPDDGDKQSDIHLGQAFPEPVRSGRGSEMRLGSVQRLEESDDIPLVGLLRGREARFVHPVVDEVILPPIHFVNLPPQILGIQIQRSLLGVVDEVVELGVEHPQDLAALVVDNRVRDLVIQHGHGESTPVIRVDLEVNLP